MNNKISVIMSAYNAEEYIDKAIKSILNQTYEDWEFIICDDASTDTTWDIIEKYKKYYPDKFIVFKNEKNLRLAYSLNECLKRATGRYIARMDADDTCSNLRFSKQVSYLEKNRDVDLVGTDLYKYDGEIYQKVKSDKVPNKKKLLRNVTFFHPTILTYSYVYEKVNGYTVKSRTKVGQDLDLWFKFYENEFIGHNINEPLYTYRIKHKRNQKSLGLKYICNMYKTRLIGLSRLKIAKFYYLILFGYLLIDVTHLIIKKVARAWQKLL